MLSIKRVYSPPSPEDGLRFLVERLWPRGFRKDELVIDAWLKDAAPSPDLRRWYAHDLNKWEAFKARYIEELDFHPETWHAILESAKKGPTTLLYSARDIDHNSARVLRDYIQQKL
jgi:uncharacterized protein YeaO (DUF488 family)